MTAKVTIKFCVPLTAMVGDTGYLHSNGGSGSINWDTPVSPKQYPLYPDGVGNFGAGLAPAGLERAGLAWPSGVLGAGLCPAGLEPAGLGAAIVEAVNAVDDCGTYRYAFKNYDACGNPMEGTPEEKEIEVHVTPSAPLGLKLVAYDVDAKVLTLAVHDPAAEPLMPGFLSRVRDGNQQESSMTGIDWDLPGRTETETE